MSQNHEASSASLICCEAIPSVQCFKLILYHQKGKDPVDRDDLLLYSEYNKRSPVTSVASQ